MNVASVTPDAATPAVESPAPMTAAPDQQARQDMSVKQDMPDKQVVVMRIDGFSYLPNRFTVMQGVPVEWRIDASEAAACGRILLAPGLGIRRLLSDRSTTMISFIPQQVGEFGFNCGMGMMTPGSKFTVVPNARG
jgi:plastocyanin domain-containing protein